MRRFLLIVASSVIAVALFSRVASTQQPPSAKSPFAGNYAGLFTASLAGGGTHYGHTTLAVANNGKCRARIANYTLGISGTITGMYSDAGEFYGQLAYDTGGVFLLHGTIRKASDGSLRGTVNQYGADGLMAASVVNLPPR